MIKKISFLLIIMLVFLPAITSAQMEFSKVVSFEGEILLKNNTAGEIYTVPNGNVWKIESLYSSSIIYLGFKINGILNTLGSVNSGSIARFPIWLKAGDTIQPFSFGGGKNGSGMGYYLISIIEITVSQ
jgi:hypothetical protein